jgi:hypothetical protein
VKRESVGRQWRNVALDRGGDSIEMSLMLLTFDSLPLKWVHDHVTVSRTSASASPAATSKNLLHNGSL